MAFSHGSAAGHSRGTPEMLSKSQSIVRGRELLHTSWDRANTAFSVFWLDQALWSLGLEGRKVGGGEGTKPTLHFHNFPSSPCVPLCMRAAGCLQSPGCLLHPPPARTIACS